MDQTAPNDIISQDESALRLIFEGTAAETGQQFFRALVKNLTETLQVDGAWVTEFLPDTMRLRAYAFWHRDHFVERYEYNLAGTPCEPVIRERRLVHFPENVIPLFPDDADLVQLQAVSYLGMPLLDTDGEVLGHLAILDSKPMPHESRLEWIFRIFASRAAAEVRRLRSEAAVREREERLSRLINSALDAIIELNIGLSISRANKAAERTFAETGDRLAGGDFARYLTPASADKLRSLMRELLSQPRGRQYLWIPGGLKALRADGGEFPAEASLSCFEVRGQQCFSLILRDLQAQIESERKIAHLVSETEYLREEIQELHNFRQLVGESAPMRRVLGAIKQVAPTNATVLISGETGTGKELVARAIHAESARADKPFVKVNCAAIPATLMESEFFGHERGAFTGATQARKGRFALADGGTIFLDEIGELPLDLQAKLLRVLQEGEFEPVGSSVTQHADVRVVAATNRALEKGVSDGQFRQDLYYRLHVFPISLPPLRERGGDILALAEQFVSHFSAKCNKRVMPLSAESRRYLTAYSWPGNVRELQNIIERAVITSQDGHLNVAALLPVTEAAPFTPTFALHDGMPPQFHTVEQLRELERQNIQRALEASGWKVSGESGAARRLGVPPSTLSSRMKALGITRPK